MLNQILGGTHLDSHGERLSKEFLERFCFSYKGKKMPLHQQHDMKLETIGYVENLQVVKDNKSEGEWNLVGDVHAKTEFLNELIGGFSISGTETIFRPEKSDFLLYIPYPAYSDNTFIEQLLLTDEIHLSKWIKKSADPVSFALFSAAIAFAITPIWDDIYKRKIAPKIDRFIDTHLEKIKDKKLGLEHIQIVDYKGRKIEIRLIGIAGKERECYSSLKTLDAMKTSVIEIESDFKEADPITRLVLFYDSGICKYKLHRTEYDSGNTVHHV